MVEKLRDLYNNIDINYDRIELYVKNCLEIDDWYYRQLVDMFIEKTELKTTVQIEECHGPQRITYFTDESIDKINSFKEQLKLLIDERNNRDNSNITST